MSRLSYKVHIGYFCRMKTAKTARAAAPARTRAADPAPRHALRPASPRRPRRLVRGRDPAAPWTDRERAAFIRALSDGLAVAEAAASVGRTLTSALAERSRDPRFAARWDAVLDCAFEVLETRLLSVAIGGVAEEAVAYGSGSGRARDDTRLAQWILANLRDGRAGDATGLGSGRRGGAAARAPAPAGPARERLDAAAEQARIDRLIDEVAEKIAAAEAQLAARRLT